MESNFTSLRLQAWRISRQRAVGFLFPWEVPARQSQAHVLQDCKPGGSLAKGPWASSSPGESLHVKARPTSYRYQEKACRQLHLEDTPLTFPSDGSCQ